MANTLYQQMSYKGGGQERGGGGRVGVENGHVHYRNNCILVKIFHVSPSVAVQKN